MDLLSLLAEAKLNAKICKKTADGLRKGATAGNAAFKAIEPPVTAEGTENNSDAVVGAVAATPLSNHVFHPAIVDDGYVDYKNDDDAATLIPPKRTNSPAPTMLSPVSNSVIASNQYSLTNGKKRLAEEEYIFAKNSKRKTGHHIDDAKANTAAISSESTAPELYNGYHGAKDSTSNRPKKKTGGARRSQLSAATSIAGPRQAGLSMTIEVSEHAPKTTQAASVPLSSGTAHHPAMVVNVGTTKSKTETTQDYTNHSTAAGGEIANAAPENTKPIPHEEKKTTPVGRTQPYGIASAARYIPSPLSHLLTPSDIPTNLSSDDSSDDSTVIYYDGD